MSTGGFTQEEFGRNVTEEEFESKTHSVGLFSLDSKLNKPTESKTHSVGLV